MSSNSAYTGATYFIKTEKFISLIFLFMLWLISFLTLSLWILMLLKIILSAYYSMLFSTDLLVLMFIIWLLILLIEELHILLPNMAFYIIDNVAAKSAHFSIDFYSYLGAVQVS